MFKHVGNTPNMLSLISNKSSPSQSFQAPSLRLHLVIQQEFPRISANKLAQVDENKSLRLLEITIIIALCKEKVATTALRS